MGVWADEVQGDIARLTAEDGEQVRITTATVTVTVNAFWEALSLSGGEQAGQRMWVATDDLPSDFTQGDTLTYDGTTYTVTHRDPDGHGMERVTLYAGW